jgi:hypothetical protein
MLALLPLRVHVRSSDTKRQDDFGREYIMKCTVSFSTTANYSTRIYDRPVHCYAAL